MLNNLEPLNKKNAEDISNKIREISRYIRFVGVIDKNGKLSAYSRRPGLKPLLNIENTQHQFSHIAIKTGMEAQFDKQLGAVQFTWEEREKAQTISFAIDKNRAWLSIDKNVIRSEVLRIVDSCLPIVKRYS
jgi:hypothetical protein